MAVVGSAYIVVNAITTGFKDQVQDILDDMDNAFKRAGRNFGAGFSSGASRGFRNIQSEAEKVYRQINDLIRQSYYLQGAIGLLVPVLGSIASGLAVVAFEAAAAAPSFIVLGGVIAAFIQGMVGLRLALSGVGKAVGSLTKPNSGIDRMPQLLRAAADATDRETEAKERLKKAQEALNEAYEISRRELERLKYDNEDAVISEKRAVIELEKAREQLLRVQDLPPNTRARREAELAFAEADLNLRRARTSVKDLQTDLNKATGDGLWNQDQQIKNSRTYTNALEDEANAQKALNKATDAKLLADKELADARAGKGQGAGADPFEGLNKFQVEFARFIAGLKPEIDKLKLAVSEGLLPSLEEAIRLVVEKLFPTIEEKLRDTGRALGKASKDFAKAITSPTAIENIGKNMDTNNYVLENTGIIIGNIARLISALLVAADPLIRKFTDWIRDLTGGWAKDAEGNISGLTDMFNKSGEIAAGFGDIIGNIVGAFINIGKAIAGDGGAGDSMMEWFIDLSQRFEDFTSKHLASGKLQEYFQKAFDGFKEILRILGKIVEAILRAGGDESIEGSMKNVGAGVDAILDKLPELIAGGAKFAEFVGKFLAFTATLLESGSIQTFFGILGKAFEILTAFFTNPIVAEGLKVVATIHAARLAFGSMGKVAAKVGKYIEGDFIVMKKTIEKAGKAVGGVKTAFSKLKEVPGMLSTLGTSLKQTSVGAKLASGATKAWTGIQAAFNAVMALNPVYLVVAAIAALIAILVVAYFKVDWFRDFVDKAFDKIVEVVKAAAEFIGKALSPVWDVISAGLQIAWDIVKGVFDVIYVVLKTFVEIIAGILLIIWKPISAGIEIAWDFVKGVFEVVVTEVGRWVEIIAGIGSTVWNWLKTGIEFVWGIVKLFFQEIIFPVISGYVRTVTGIGKTVWDWLSGGISKAWGIVKGFWDKYIFPFISGLGQVISKLASGMWDGLKSGLEAVVNFIVRGLNLVIDAINLLIKGANAVKIGKDIPLISKIPTVRLAEGGVVPATPGGILATIGEAGRPERVEPLDEDGLSKRDRAMITMLAGGRGGGVTINVHPSPGMDEVELASLVSRQLAFQLRAGSV